MAPRARLDTELVRRGLARSREHAQELVAAGRVLVAGRAASKPATAVGRDDPVLVAARAGGPDYVSRGAHKLAHALAEFAIDVSGLRVLDAGASTGGFTDVLLRAGAREVVAVDVGYGQLAWSLQQDERVTVVDRTNIRRLEALPGGPADFVVSDLSFIPLSLVLGSLVRLGKPGCSLVTLVKPQFEVGRERLPNGGVVRDPAARLDAILGVVAAAHELGLGVAGVVASPLPGPAGNVEYLLWLRPGPDAVEPGPAALAAVEQGPQ